MTMHVVLGNGEMTRKELTETLADIWKADEKAESTFWFLLQGKAEPTDTDKFLVSWLEKNDIYYEIITDDAASVDPVYSQPQEVHEAKRLGQKIVSLLGSKPEDDESAELLALFASSDPDAEEDRWLNTICQSVFDAEYPIRALNDGLVEVDLSGGDAPAEEPEQEPEKPKSVAKKAAPRAPGRPLSIVPPDDTEVSQAETPTREELEKMELPELKEVAASLGITLPGRTRMNTYIEAILAGGVKETTPVAEVTEAPEVGESATLNGFDPDAFAEELAARIAHKFLNALKEALSEV